MNRLQEAMVTNLVGVASGLGTSFFSWWVLFHVIVPKIDFSKKISKRKAQDNSGYTYRIKIANSGNRDIVSVECTARLIVDWDGTNNWKAFYIPLNPAGDRKTELPKISKGGVRVFRLYISQIKSLRMSSRVPANIKLAAEDGTLELEEILCLGTNAKLKIYIAGNDGFSGARKVFESSYYSLSDIVSGRFQNLEVVPAAPDDEEDIAEIKASNLERGSDHGSDRTDLDLP